MTETEKKARRRDEERALDRSELALSDAARYPALGEMRDADLSDLVSRLRQRRDRARQIARRQRREMTGRDQPRGATPARDDSGSQDKKRYLAAALRRAEAEVEKRHRAAEPTQAELSRRALETRIANEGDAHHPSSDPTPNEGVHSIPYEDSAPSGAFDDVGHKVVLERSRKVR